MSGFFRTGETSSSEEYTESSSSEEESQQQKGKNVRSLLSSSSDDEGPRRVLSVKDKHHSEFQQIIDSTLKQLRSDEYNKANDIFKGLPVAIVKARQTIQEHGFPKFILKGVLDIEVGIKKTNPSTLDASNQKAYRELQQKVVKFIQQFQKLFDNYKSTEMKPSQPKSAFFGGSSEDEDDEDYEEDDDEQPIKKSIKKPEYSDEDEDDEDEEELTDELTEEESEGEIDDDIDLSKFTGKITRDFWVKKVTASTTTTISSSSSKATDYDAQRKAKQQEKQQLATQKKEQEELQLRNDKGEILTKAEAQRLRDAKSREKEEITPAIMARKLREMIASRGKRSADIPAMLSELHHLEPKAEDQATVLRIRTLVTLLSFDHYSRPQHGGSMQLSHWRECSNSIINILITLENNVNSVRLAEDDGLDETMFDTIEFDDEVEQMLHDSAESSNTASSVAEQKAWYDARKQAFQLAKEKAKQQQQAVQAQISSSSNIQYVEGNLYSFLHKLSSEYYTGLQNCDHIANSNEYVNRLRELTKLLSLLKRVYKYYLSINKIRLSQRIAEIILEYIYYHYDEAKDVLVNPVVTTSLVADIESNDVDFWAEIVLQSDEPRSRIKALLYQLYSWAIHNKYNEAKDRLEMSYLSQTINELDPNTRILYNRTTTQLGLAAFRTGDYKGALLALSDLYTRGPRIKELLAQGVASSYQQLVAGKDDQDYLEAKRRVYPYHQHINMDFLDAAHLISAMIIEVPSIVENGPNSQRRVLSKSFRRHYMHYLERINNSNIVPSIDTSRDAILCASYNMSIGNWRRAVELIMDVKVLWSSQTFTECVIETMKASLTQQIKQQALKCYCLTGINAYQSISLSTLVKQFDMEENHIKTLINQQAYNEVIHAAWDSSVNPTDPVLVISTATNQINHRTAAQYVDRLQSLVTTMNYIQKK